MAVGEAVQRRENGGVHLGFASYTKKNFVIVCPTQGSRSIIIPKNKATIRKGQKRAQTPNQYPTNTKSRSKKNKSTPLM